MPSNGSKINYQIGYTVDKNGLRELESSLERLVNLGNNTSPANELYKGYQRAGEAAQKLQGILEKTFNVNLGSLNVTKFNQELTNAGMSLKSVHADMMAAGQDGTLVWARMSNAILGTNLQLKESNKLLDSMATTMMNTVRWGISTQIFNNITGSIQRAFNYSKNLDSSLNDIRITTGKTADEMERFARSANETAQAIGASTLDVTSASLIYSQQGKIQHSNRS